ncbi:hypothetical protein D3C83_249950 [compost metagenome]
MPVAIYLAALAVPHAVRGLGLLWQVVVAIVLVLVAALSATWIGVPAAGLVTALIVCGLVAANVVTLSRRAT